MPVEKLLLVIPAFRESGRLPAYIRELLPALAAAAWTTRLRIVDDGSGPEEVDRLRQLLAAVPPSGNVATVALDVLAKNRGKGAAIRHGWAAATDETVLGFVDADGSIPAGEVVRSVSWLFEQPTRPAVFGSRVKMLGRTVHREAFRHYVGRVFATIASEGLRVPVYDSQCGLKLVPRPAYEQIKRDLCEDGFCLDLEVLVELRRCGCPVVEFPIDWHDEPGSRVRVFRDGWRMIRAVARLRRRQRSATGNTAPPRHQHR